ncbi:flippase [Haloplanus salinarum]|uniref:flippase n=1 Tax=Haloplanus salinarum TaxID=1912324 RepID=UPI00214AAD17|nr:flippase [Haloplanus salinarum]
MSDHGFRGILASASVVGAGMLFSKAITLFAEIAVARELATAEFGAAIFAYTILLTIGGIALIGIPEGFTYYLSILDERGDTESAFRIVVSGVVILAVVLGTSVFTIYAIPFALVEPFGVSRAQWGWLELLAPLAIAYPVSQLSFGIMRGYDRSLPKVLSDDVLNKLIAFGALGVAIWQNAGMLIFLSFYLGQYLLSSLFAGGYAIYLLKTKLTRVTALDRFGEDARRLFSYSWPLAFKNATRRLLGNTDIVLVGALLASSAVGYYRVGYVISQLGMIALVSITYLFTPRMARRYDNDDREGMEYLYRRATKWSTLLAFPLLLTMIYYPTELIELFFGAEYAPGSVVLIILAVDVLFRTGMGTAAAVLRAIDRTRVDFVVTAVTTIANVGLSYVLIRELGVVGAAVGTFLSILFMNTVQIFLVYSFVSIHPFSKRYITGTVSLGVVSVLIFLLIDSTIGDMTIGRINLSVTMVLFAAVFVTAEILLAWFGGLLIRSEKDAIHEAVRGLSSRIP